MKMKTWMGILTGALMARRLFDRFRRFELDGKVAVITGGTRGLGLVLARQLIEHGAKVAICSRDQAEVDRARDELLTAGGTLFAAACDVTDEDHLKAFLEQTERELGPIDLLINNAGQIQVGPMELMRTDDYEAAMRVHFWAPLHATLAVLPSRRARKSGRIVNITSIGAKVPIPHLLAYSASKYAAYGFSAGLNTELAREGIRVTTVCPGLMRTGSPRNAQVKGQHRAEYTWFKIGDSLPGLSMNAERAARQIIDAAVRGDAEVTLSLPAKGLTMLYGLAPSLMQRLFGLVSRALPTAEGASEEQVKGKDVELSGWPIKLTRLTDAASVRNNEI